MNMKEFIVYIIDNNSAVQDYESLKEIIAEYDNVEIWRNETKLEGSIAHGTALNELVKKVKTPYTSILDADATWLKKGWDKILISQMDDKLKIIGSEAPYYPPYKPKDFPLMFAILYETETFNKLNIDFRPLDIAKGIDTGWELREKYLAANYAGKNLEAFGNESRPVKFTVGGSYSSLNLKSDSGSDKTSSTTFDYLALSVPMGKFGFGFGLMPFTSVGYKLESLDQSGNISNRFRGEGGLNKAFLGLGYQITEGLSIGVDAHYNFGNIQNSTIEFMYDTDGDPTQYQSRENNRSDLSGLNLNLGLSYKTMLNEKLEFVSALTFTPESTLTSKMSDRFLL